MTDNPAAESRARPAEIIFEVTEAVEGGYDARALGYSIYTQGGEAGAPRVIRLHVVREEAIAV